jgi:hypothetical protein
MSGEAAAVGGGEGEANGIPPNVTIYINNLNEKIKLEGLLLPRSAPSLNPRDLCRFVFSFCGSVGGFAS